MKRTEDNETIYNVIGGSFLDKNIMKNIDLSVKSEININDREYTNEDKNEVFINYYFLIY